MQWAKKYGKTILFFLGVLFFGSFLFSLFNLGGWMQTKTTDLFLMILMIVTFLIIGFHFGKTATKKGYLEGLKIGGCLLFFLIFINVIFYQNGFSVEKTIYYLVLILSSIFGSMIGINKKAK